MKKAIITGASGLVGRSVAKYLLKKNIDVLCLGRKNLDQTNINKLFGRKAKYIQLSMKNIENLPNKINNIDWECGNNCVFYNFAWSGINDLTDGKLEDQLENAIQSSLAVKVVKKLGCIKFINCGTIEENYAKWHLRNNIPFQSSHCNYAIAKIASNDMCNIVSYLEKIDYVHTRLSVPLSPNLNIGGYISKTLKNILDKKQYEKPQNKQLYDIIFTPDAAEAYYLIGLHGKNKADYFIGSGKPTTLNNYFENIRQIVMGIPVKNKDTISSDSLDFFSTEDLYKDTGFVAKYDRLDLLGAKES